MRPLGSVPIAKVPIVRMRAAQVFAEAVAMLGDRSIAEDESNVTARLSTADDDLPEIAAPDIDVLPMETARGGALVDPPEGNAAVEPRPEPIPEYESALFPAALPQTPRKRAARRQPRGGVLLLVASCIGMMFAGTAIGSMQFAASTQPPAATPAKPLPVDVAEVVESLPPPARPALAIAAAPRGKKKPALPKKTPAAIAKKKKARR